MDQPPRRPHAAPPRAPAVIDHLPRLQDLSAQLELGRQEALQTQDDPDPKEDHDSEPRRSGP
jgi:hypothetical protein